MATVLTTNNDADYKVGDKVLARFGGRKWYAATIERVNDNGTYDVEYYDGDEVRSDFVLAVSFVVV